MSGMSAAKCPIMPSEHVKLVQAMYTVITRHKSSLHVHVTYSLIQMGFLIIVVWLQSLVCFLCYQCCNLLSRLATSLYCMHITCMSIV